MKKFANKSIVLCLTLFLVYSCDSDDKVVDQILEEVGTGGVLRTIDEENDLVYDNTLNAFDDESSYTIVLEEQDEEGGALLESVEIFVNYDDNSEGGTDISTEEVSLQTLSASDFTQGDRGLPQATVSYSADELIAATGIDESLVVGKDRFEFRLVLTLSNGEIYTNTDVGGPVSGGAYFSAPFEYFPVIACSITEDLSGTHSYSTTVNTTAPGQTAPGQEDVTCTIGAVLTGEVTWTATDDIGVYSSSDMSFGQFGSCYDGRGDATGEDITIEWDCTSLVPDGEVYLKDGVVIADDDDEDQSLTYGYEITNVNGAEMTIDFSNSLGDTGTVVLTREDGQDWPVIFTANNME